MFVRGQFHARQEPSTASYYHLSILYHSGSTVIVSPLEKYQDIIVGLGAAHAFKFAPAFGRALAELAIDGKSTEDLSRFGIPNNPTSASRL